MPGDDIIVRVIERRPIVHRYIRQDMRLKYDKLRALAIILIVFMANFYPEFSKTSGYVFNHYV